MSEVVQPVQLYDYFVLPREDEFVFQWGDEENEDCHIWLGAVHDAPDGQETAVLFPCVSARQARENDVARIRYYKHRPGTLFRMLEPEFLNHTCGNAMCVNPDHMTFTPPVLPVDIPPAKKGEGRKRKELDEKTLNLAYTLYTVHGQTLDAIRTALKLQISRATLHRRLEERKHTYV